MNFDLHMGVGAEFIIEKFNKDGVVWKSDPIKNMVLDCGLLSLYTYSLVDMTEYINIGSGTSQPIASQTGLENRLYSTKVRFVSDWNSHQVIINPYAGLGKVFQFSIGSCTGTFTELGLSRTANTTYFNRQRIKDAQGNEIAVIVAADEGLRITCIIKLCLDPSIKPYGKIVKINLSGATSGGITISNPTKSKTYAFTLTQLRGCPYTSVETAPIDGLFNNNLLVDGFTGAKYNADDDCLYVAYGWKEAYYKMPLIYNDIGITSHTLVGHSSEPVVTVVQAYDESFWPVQHVDFLDETTGTTVSYAYYKQVNLQLLGTPHTFLAPLDLRSYSLTDIPISNWNLKTSVVKTAPSSQTVITAPTLGNPTLVKKAYFAPGRLGTGTVSIAFVGLAHAGDAWPYGFICFNFVENISVTNTEEIEFTFTLTWGNFTG